MGNKFTRRRPIVDERYTRPQGLYQHRDIDHRKLRRLILNGQLGPCFPGVEDPAAELDECPICFLFYPSLNRSKCCTKGICTECYLQIKSSNSARSTQCPFCKTANYAVEYRGAKTVEEKGVEQAEEQKVIEAKIRIRQKELLDEEQRLLRREEDVREGRVPAVTELVRRNFSNLHGFTLPSENSEAVPSRDQDTDTLVGAVPNDVNSAHQGFSENAIAAATAEGLPAGDSGPTPEVETVMHYNTARLPGSQARSNREDDFDLDLEDIMLMEAIWLSIQEQGQSRQDSSSANRVPGMCQSAGNQMDQSSTTDTDSATSQAHVLSAASGVTRRNSMTGGLAGAIAALAEQQVIGVDSMVGPQTSQRSPQNDIPHVDSNRDLLSENSNSRTLHGLGDHQLTDNRAGAFLASPSMPQTQEGATQDMEREEQHAKAETREVRCQDQDARQELNNWIEVSIESGRAIPPLARGESRGSISDWVLDQSSEVVEVGTSFSSSVPSTSELPWEAPDMGAHQNPECAAEPPVTAAPAPMLPESFEEQVMLAMALSLAEAQAQARRS